VVSRRLPFKRLQSRFQVRQVSENILLGDAHVAYLCLNDQRGCRANHYWDEKHAYNYKRNGNPCVDSERVDHCDRDVQGQPPSACSRAACFQSSGNEQRYPGQHEWKTRQQQPSLACGPQSYVPRQPRDELKWCEVRGLREGLLLIHIGVAPVSSDSGPRVAVRGRSIEDKHCRAVAPIRRDAGPEMAYGTRDDERVLATARRNQDLTGT